MAKEIRSAQSTGQAIYAQVRKSDTTYYKTDTTSFESYNAAHWVNYAVALTEISTTGEYYADFPSAITGAGVYDVILYSRAGGSPASSDTKLSAGGSIYWDGTQELTIVSIDGEIDAIGSGSISIISSAPVSQDLSISIFQGDDYYSADGRALEWMTSDVGTWPTLTGATITFTATKTTATVASGIAGDVTVTATGSVVTATGANKKVRIELSSVNTDSLSIGAHVYNYDIQATLATSLHKVTLASGTMTVREGYTP